MKANHAGVTAVGEHVKTLWLLECKERGVRRLFTFYAIDGQEAETIVQRYLSSRPELSRRSLTCKPHGFTIMHSRRPGHITVKE